MKRLLLIAVAMAAVSALTVGSSASAKATSGRTSDHWTVSSTGGHVVKQRSDVRRAALSRAALSAKVRRMLQASGTTHQCSGTYSESLITFTQTCTITPADGANVVCVEQTDEPVMTQICDITQAATATGLHAKVLQVAATDKGSTPQRHTQFVKLTQTNTAGSNFFSASQVVKESLGPGHFDDTDESEPESTATSSPPSLMQDFHQNITVDQDTGSGNNSSDISQFGKQRMRAMQGTTISEFQNTTPAVGIYETCPAGNDPDGNMCSLVDQTNGTGQNVSTYNGNYLQFERVHKALGGDQQQGVGTGVGGLDHTVHQTSSGGGFCKIVTDQNEREVMRAVQANVFQVQHGPTRKGAGSFQDCNSASTWTGDQDSAQLATARPKVTDIDSLVFASAATQDNTMQYFGVTSGNIHATQSVTEQNNGAKETKNNSCPAADAPSNACGAQITCVEGTCTPTQEPPCGPGFVGGGEEDPATCIPNLPPPVGFLIRF